MTHSYMPVLHPGNMIENNMHLWKKRCSLYYKPGMPSTALFSNNYCLIPGAERNKLLLLLVLLAFRLTSYTNLMMHPSRASLL